MSGALGLVEANILFAEAGSEQDEFWRLFQSFLGIGAIRVLSSICVSPCWEFLHQMYGIKLPESVEAREFWLRQPSWTEISQLGLTQEDTSYHRINQGSGPQAKVLWTWDDICKERDWWLRRQSVAPPREKDEMACEISEVKDEPKDNFWLDRMPKNGITPNIYVSRHGADITEATTDKWWMDRWQVELLAVAAIRQITIGEASALLTAAYFGKRASPFWHYFYGILCCIFTISTFVLANFTDWSWTLQFGALSCLGYFVSKTACLRPWMYCPSFSLSDARPRLLSDWPESDNQKSIVRIAVQSAGFCHLRGLVEFDRRAFEKAREEAMLMEGRYKSAREAIKEFKKPYTSGKDDDGTAASSVNWLSYEAQSSFYGLVASVAPDNVALRSMSVLAALVNGLVLLILGFGGTVKSGWSSIVLGIYIAGIVMAVSARSRTEKWTLPEFEVVDLTLMQVPPAVKKRIWMLKGAEPLKMERGDRVPSMKSMFPTPPTEPHAARNPMKDHFANSFQGRFSSLFGRKF
jgi:hypothetical protein